MKVKLVDLGKARSEDMHPQPVKVVKGKTKTKTDYPSLSLSSDEDPIVKKLQRGDECTLTFDAVVTGTNEADWQGEGVVSVNFKLKKGSVEPFAADHKSTDAAYNAAKKETKG